MVSDAFEYVAQVAFGIQVVEFRGTETTKPREPNFAR
jgi:hypothetical protein